VSNDADHPCSTCGAPTLIKAGDGAAHCSCGGLAYDNDGILGAMSRVTVEFIGALLDKLAPPPIHGGPTSE
jgi:hypothetical protein